MKLFLLSWLTGCSSSPPVPSSLGEFDLLLVVDDYHKSMLVEADGERRRGALPPVPAAGLLATPMRPLALRASNQAAQHPRRGIIGIGPVESIGSVGNTQKLGNRIYQYAERGGARDLGPWPPPIANLEFGEPFLTSDQRVVAWSGDQLILFDLHTQTRTPVPMPDVTLPRSGPAGWFDVIPTEPPTWIACTEDAIVWWQDGPTKRHPVSTHHHLYATTSGPWVAALSDSGGVMIHAEKGVTHDLGALKSPPNGRLMFGPGQWSPGGARFAWWSSAFAGAVSNGVAYNERFDLVRLHPQALEPEIEILYPARKGGTPLWTWFPKVWLQRLSEPL